jgi:cellulose biosynthesis protein BcsQ
MVAKQGYEGRIATFYSYKGGTGRSMALANFAWLLASSGRRVLAIDWDLEAPGLHRYFRPFLIDPDLFETDGLIDTFWNFAASAMAKIPSSMGPNGADSEEIVEAIDDTKRRLDFKFPAGGFIDLVGAGRQGPTYSERVNSFDWKRFYELGGAEILTAAKQHLRSQYDWVLIDSRTGVSDTAGICTIQLPDTVVACFTLNRQSVDGVDAVLKSIRAFRSPSIDGSEIKLFPVATRIENAEQKKLEAARTYAREKLQAFLPNQTVTRDRGYWDDMEIAYRPWYAYEEVLAAFGDATDSTRAADTMLGQMEAMSRRVTDDNTLRASEVLPADRAAVLARYSFEKSKYPVAGRGVAIGKTAVASDPEKDAHDLEYLRGLLAKEELWRTTGYSWKYLLSSRELAMLVDADRQSFGRSMVYYIANSELGQKYFGRLRGFALFNSLVVGLPVLAMMIALIADVGAKYRDPSIFIGVPIVAGFAALGFWSLFAAIEGIVLRLLTNAPEGVGIVDTIACLFKGQSNRAILDYPGFDRLAEDDVAKRSTRAS